MIQSLLLLGCILFLIIFVYSYQMRSRMYREYPTSCNVTYIPEKEKIVTMSEQQFEENKFKFKRDDSYLIYNPQTIQGF